MIDAHAHLDACDGDPSAIVERARAAGVTRIVTIGTGRTVCQCNTKRSRRSALIRGSLYRSLRKNREFAHDSSSSRRPSRRNERIGRRRRRAMAIARSRSVNQYSHAVCASFCEQIRSRAGEGVRPYRAM